MKGINSKITLTTETIAGSMTTTMRDNEVEIGQVVLSDWESLIPEIVVFEVEKSHRKRGFGYMLLEEVISQYQKRNKQITALKVIPNECRNVEQEDVEKIYTKLSHKLYRKYGIPIYQYKVDQTKISQKYQMSHIKDTDYYIISGSLLRGIPKGADNGNFWSLHNCSYDEFVNFMKDSQVYFDDIKNNNAMIDNKYYFIYASQEYFDRGFANNVVKVRDIGENVNAHYVFVERPVIVTKKEDGYYYAGDDGRHRFMIAQEYGFDLLVRLKN